MMDTFSLFWERLPYLQQSRPERDRVPHIGERTIEIPIARLWLDRIFAADSPRIVEVGAVMPYYGQAPWAVIDPYDPHPACERIDALDYDYRGKYVLSISTIEHIGMVEYGNTVRDDKKAARCFERIVQQSAGYLISWPIGHNAELDAYARDSAYPRFMYRQCSPDNRWEQVAERWDFEYGAPYKYGNGVVFFASLAVEKL